MIKAFFSGVLFGLSLAFALGPALFSLIQTSIKRGFRSGLYFSIGIFASDLTILFLFFWGISSIITAQSNQMLLGIIGSGVLIFFGIFTFLKKPEIDDAGENGETMTTQNSSPLKYIAKGFVLNVTNPAVWLIWGAITTFGTSSYPGLYWYNIIFLFGVLFTIFTTDIIKCFIAGQIKQFLRPRIVSFINHAIGILLIIFGIIMFINVLGKYVSF